MLTPQYAITTAPQAVDLAFSLPNDFLRLDSDQEQDTVELLLETAVEWAEMYTARVLRLTSFTAQFACFESESVRPYLKIRRSPLIDVLAVRVTEEGNLSPTTPTPTLVQKPSFSEVWFPKGTTFDLDPDVDYPIEIDFRAGYSPPGAASPLIPLPNSVRTGIKQHVAFMFENRGDVEDDTEKGVPEIVKRSYDTVRIFRTCA